MRIVLIGFSGTGKSHWSKLLVEQLGYHHICCDDEIEKKLAGHLPTDSAGIADVAEWMGQPYDERFKANEARYLQCETEVLEEVFSKGIENYPERTVLDTTGSVIYTGVNLTRRLSEFGKVVYLEVTPAVLEQMFQLYLSDPKPVIWGESYSKNEGEAQEEALKRCYPELLRFRETRYRALADVSLSYEQLRETGLTAEGFLKMIKDT